MKDHPGFPLLIAMLFFYLTAFPQQPWQKLATPAVKEAMAKFAEPPAEHGITLWWGWDGPVNDSVIIRDLDKIKSFGYQSVMIEAGYGMMHPYLSEGWFNLVKFAVEQAKLRNMRVWIEDEGKYPSGFAGGKFSMERPDLRMQALMPDVILEVQPGGTIRRKVGDNVISAAAVNEEGRIVLLPLSDNELVFTVPEGKWKIHTVRHQFKTSPTRSVNNPTHGKDTSASLFDYLNPEATRQFITWTHKQYKKYFGNEFGKTVMGIMGDEPDFSYTPWTPKITTEFLQRKGFDVTPFLATFFMNELSDSLKRIKADYWDVWSDLFKENFFDIQSEWCRQNNIEYIVHLNHEDKAMALARSEGDFFKNMRNVDVPGVDAIWSQIWMDHVADYPKLASSASHVFGKPRAFTESFAAYTYKPSVAQAKWVMDYQLVRGINLVQNMFWPSSAGKTGITINFFMNDSFPAVASYINRSSYLLSQGIPAAQIAVYYPTTSMWLGNEESDRSVWAIARELTERQHDFDFIDEQALTQVLENTEGRLRNLSGQHYQTVIVPSITAISKASLDQLKLFATGGGKVVFMGELSAVTYEKSFLESESAAVFPRAIIESSGTFSEKVMEALPQPDVKLDKSVPAIKYLHRNLADGEMYFFFNEGIADQKLNATIYGTGPTEEWNAMSGMISRLIARPDRNGYQKIRLELKGWETKFVIVSR